MKTVFERMQDYELRKEFVNHKGLHIVETDEDFQKLSKYILSKQCDEDIERLKNGDYFLEPPTRFKIKKIASNKHRICYKFKDNNSYLLKLCSYVLLDYDFLYQPSLYSFRPNKNHAAFFARLKKIDFSRRFYVLKMDIHAYGESVDQDILLEKLKPIFKDDPGFYDFLNWLLKRNQFYEKGQLMNERISIIPGVPIGSFLNNIYLLEIDDYLKANSILCMRYTDDIAAFVRTRKEAEDIRDHLLKEFDRLHLYCNPEKTHIYEPKEPFSILGIKASPSEFDIAPGSVSKIIYKLNKRRNRLLKKARNKLITQETAYNIGLAYANQLFRGIEEDPNATNWSAWSFGIITTDKTLKLLDYHTEQYLRTLKSGKMGKARYRVKYDELKDTGYVTLVNQYYHYKDEHEKESGNN